MTYCRNFLVFVAISVQFTGRGQSISPDSMHQQFKKCIEKYLEKRYLTVDSNLICFYGNEYNVYMEMIPIDEGSGRYYSKRYSRPSDSLKPGNLPLTSSFYKTMSFIDFINFIISQTPGRGCIFPTTKGVLAFVHSEDEYWEEFYFEKLIFKKEFYITPTIDIIQSDGLHVKYKREIFVCKYDYKKGFDVERRYMIREDTICTVSSLKSGTLKQ